MSARSIQADHLQGRLKRAHQALTSVIEELDSAATLLKESMLRRIDPRDLESCICKATIRATSSQLLLEEVDSGLR